MDKPTWGIYAVIDGQPLRKVKSGLSRRRAEEEEQRLLKGKTQAGRVLLVREGSTR